MLIYSRLIDGSPVFENVWPRLTVFMYGWPRDSGNSLHPSHVQEFPSTTHGEVTKERNLANVPALWKVVSFFVAVLSQEIIKSRRMEQVSTANS